MLAGKNGLAWVRRGAGARRDRKTSEIEGSMVEKDMFCDACQGDKKQEVVRYVWW